MSIDTAAILAAKYKDNPIPLREAVLGRGEANINAYAALRALQLQKEAQQFQMAQAAMQGQQYQNQPSMVEQAVAPQMPQQMPQGQPQMPPQQAPQGGQGLASMPVPEQNFAPGGIVAFAGDDSSLVEEDDQLGSILSQLEGKESSPGDPATYAKMSALFPQLMQQVASQKYTPMKDEDFTTAFEKRRTLLEDKAGPSPFGEFKTKLANLESGREERVKQGRGLAILQSLPEVLAPGGLERGLARGAGKFGAAYEKVLEADKAEQKALMSMNFNLADAQRKEAMGLNKEALLAADQARIDHNAAQKFKLEKVAKLASLATAGARATKPTGTGEKPSDYRSAVADLFAEMKESNDKLPENKRKSDAQLKAEAHRVAAPMFAKVPAGETIAVKREDIGATREKTASQERKETAEKAQRDAKEVQDALEKFDKSGANRRLQIQDPKAYADKREAYEKELRKKFPDAPGGSSAPPPPAGNKNSSTAPAGGKVATRADIKATAKATGKTEAEVEAAAKAKGYTIK